MAPSPLSLQRTLYMAILVGFLFSALPFLFLCSLLIHLFLSAHFFTVIFFFYPESDPSRHSPSPHPHPQHDVDLCIYIDHVAGNLVLVALPFASSPLCFVWFGLSPVISQLSLANVQDTTAYFAKISLS